MLFARMTNMGLEKLLYLQGVGAEFIDCFGNHVHISPNDRKGILTSMCLAPHQSDVDGALSVLNDKFIEQRIHELDVAPWLKPIGTFQWTYVDEPYVELCLTEHFVGYIRLHLFSEQNESFRFQIHSSQLTAIGDYKTNDCLYIKYHFLLNEHQNNAIGLGYHQLTCSLDSDNHVTEYLCQLMLAPRLAYSGSLSEPLSSVRYHQQATTGNFSLSKKANPWGISTQLYSIKSESQWGVGDFNDLQKLIVFSAEQGADFILLNPLHALDLPSHISPYSPDDRRRLNPLYIHIESVKEYDSVKHVLSTPDWQINKHKLFENSLLDYAEVYALKQRVFCLLFDTFIEENQSTLTDRFQAFSDFKKQHEQALQQYADWQVGHHKEDSCQATFSNPDFWCYLQFVATSQLSLCQLTAKSVGMSIGLIRDMAVGASPTGSEVQQNADYFCANANIGAPPDPFAPQGQNWGLAPMDPIKLQQLNFLHFIDLIRSNMQSCGGLRIDHVMGLLRLWWWPKNLSLGDGAYVYYPLDALLAILSLESQRAQCIVIGEDLGIVPPEIVQNLSNANIFSNELFYFSKQNDGFTSPEHYKRQSLMMLANHDVPTLSAWWHGNDIELRHQLNLINHQQQQEMLNERDHEKHQLIHLFCQKGILLFEGDINRIEFDVVLTAWLQLSASGNSSLYSVQLEDLICETMPVNIPGTWKEYPNWRRRLSMSLEHITTSDAIKQRLSVINHTRMTDAQFDQ